MTQFSTVTLVVLIAFLVCQAYAAGGVAELKALTGDAPYMGYGNQEQAPEYFGDALVRQYYQNPAYGYAPRTPYSTYNYRAAYAPYRPPYGAYPGGVYPGGQTQGAPYSGQTYVPATETIVAQPAPVASVASTGGGFYQGRGNEWVKKL